MSKNSIQSIVYVPDPSNLKYISDEYAINKKTKYSIIKQCGDSAWILYEFFYEKHKYNYFSPTNDAVIGKDIGWTASKVTRIKSLLKKNNLLLILKDTGSDGTVFYRTILNPDLIEFYLKNNELPEEDGEESV
jgi:hypothetical protein